MPIHDIGDATVPILIGLSRRLWARGPELWMPAMACGVDRLANNLPYASPSGVLFAALPGWLAYAALVVARHFLVGYFAYRLSRDRLKFGERASVFSGAVCAVYSAYYVVVFQWGFEAFPLVAWALEEIEERPRGRLEAAALGLAYSFCSSLPMTLPFCLAMAAAWFLLVRRKTAAGFWRDFLIFSAASALPQARAFWAMWVNAPFSQRADWASVSSLAAVPAECASLLGDYTIAALLCLLGLAWGGWRDALFRRLFACFLFCAAGAPLIRQLQWILAPQAGFLRGYQADRFYPLAPVFAGLAAARAAGFLPRPRLAAGAAAILLAAGSLASKKESALSWYYYGSCAANYQSPVLASLSRDGAEPFRVASFTHGLFPAYANAYGLETADGYINLYPKAYQRFWMKVIEPFARLHPVYGRFFGATGYQIFLYVDSIADFPGGLDFGSYYRLNLLSLANTKYVISRHPLLHPDLEQVLGQAPWSSLSEDERRRLKLRENFHGKSYLYVYRNKACLPRAFLVGRARVFSSADRMLEAMAGAGVAELGRTAFIERAEAAGWDGAPLTLRRASARFVRYGSDHIELAVKAEGRGILIVSNSYSPFWKCRIGGKEVPLRRVDGAFWGVMVEPGESRVSFEYRPPYAV